MKGSAQFFSTLVEHPTRKWMVTCPSMSPEHYPTSLSESVPFWDEVTNLHLKGTTIYAGPTMDMSILRSLFDACIQPARHWVSMWIFAVACRLRGRQAGALSDRQIRSIAGMDRRLGRTYRSSPPSFSALGALSGSEITPMKTPKLAAAATKLLDFRERGPGWTMAWKICLRARLFDGEIAARTLADLLTAMDDDQISYKDGGTYLNLMKPSPFNSMPTWEQQPVSPKCFCSLMPAKSICFPAVPAAWANGSVEGFKARGGFVVDMKWKSNKVTAATIHSA